MGHHQEGPSRSPAPCGQGSEYGLASEAVHIACGFVCKQDPGPVDECPRHRRYLTFASGEMSCKSVLAMSHLEFVEEIIGSARFSTRTPWESAQRKLDILEGGQVWEQMVKLEYHTEVFGAPPLGNTELAG